MICNHRPPKPVDLNATISEVQKIFRTIVGEKIVLRTTLDPNLGLIAGNPRTIGSILVKLFMQARDAMAAAGELIVTTSNAEFEGSAAEEMDLLPGRYALLQLLVNRSVEIADVRESIEELDGAIWVKSAPNDRFAVTVALPQAAR